MKKVIVLVLATISLAGCHKTHSVAWYRQHPHHLSETLRRCGPSNNSGVCKTATKAQEKNMLAAPPVKFNGEND
ncbi:EexN family lipoprotein [Acidiphilium acidophilum]|uniref:EexN family lipoprotein n=1 Tax=Acidiphilium acidophilum TaxID=76588 RepID=A0AAW9DLK3_ACIAO|nr:EexN family lipoprotein [Acidiphilium acidophilum]